MNILRLNIAAVFAFEVSEAKTNLERCREVSKNSERIRSVFEIRHLKDAKNF